jgi:hypothetical protein
MQEVGKRPFWGDSVIGRTHVRTKRLNEKLIEIQRKKKLGYQDCSSQNCQYTVEPFNYVICLDKI